MLILSLQVANPCIFIVLVGASILLAYNQKYEKEKDGATPPGSNIYCCCLTIALELYFG